MITESINCRIIKNLFGNSYLVLKTEQLDSFLLYLENLRDDSEFFNSFYDIFYNKILKVENKSDAVSADFLCDETVGISNLDDADQLLIDKGSLGINEVIIDPTVCNEEIQFTISNSEWSQITRLEGDSLVFSRDWTNLFNSKVENYYQCVLSFKYKKVSKLNSRKRNCCFFRAKAVCKFNSCFEFCFTIRENPTNVIVDGIVVNCAVTGTLSPEHNNTDIVHSRHLSNMNRIKVAKELSDKPVSNYFYDQFSSPTSTNNALDYGNFNKIQSTGVLRKVKCDLASSNRFSNDNWIELTKLQENYSNTILDKHINGYITIFILQSLYSTFIY